jgi:hypothetical protein
MIMMKKKKKVRIKVQNKNKRVNNPIHNLNLRLLVHHKQLHSMY